MKKLTCADFTAHLNSKFTAHVADGDPEEDIPDIDVELELVAARDRSNDQCERFSVTFTGPKESAMGQGCFPLKHEAMGDQDIFLVPVSEDEEAGTVSYEAVFNRLKDESAA